MMFLTSDFASSSICVFAPARGGSMMIVSYLFNSLSVNGSRNKSRVHAFLWPAVLRALIAPLSLSNAYTFFVFEVSAPVNVPYPQNKSAAFLMSSGQ